MSEQKAIPRYSTAALLQAAKGVRRDALAVVLIPGREYTEAEAQKLVSKFLTKEVR